jgi:hypothetical protein
MHESSRHRSKTMVLGARTATRSAFFVLSDLVRERVQATDNFLAVYDPRLDTGYIYVREVATPLPVAREEGKYLYAGALHRADGLPLAQPVAVEAFLFAWHAFYPNSESLR